MTICKKYCTKKMKNSREYFHKCADEPAVFEVIKWQVCACERDLVGGINTLLSSSLVARSTDT